MGEGFYIASKTVGRLAQVESWLVILLVLAFAAMWRGRRGWALGWTGAALGLVLALTIFPLGNPLLAALEGRYPPAPPLARVDGIIVLGGGEDLGPYWRWGGVQTNDAGERLTAGLALARHFPGAKLIYTGGTAGLVPDADKGAPSRMVGGFWADMGIRDDRIVLEGRSRNTWENAVFTKDLVQPQPGQAWVLVTSAWHMPRAMATFEKAGWTDVTAWPVDYRSRRNTWLAEWQLDAHLIDIDMALKENLGLLAYWVAGKS